MFSFKNKIMTKVTLGCETVPFNTEKEWEDFWGNLCGDVYAFVHAQDTWNTYNKALQEIKNGKKLSGYGLYFRKWDHLVKALKVDITALLVY